MKCFVLKNKNGEFFSPRSGRCTADFSPFSHLFKDLKSAKSNKSGYSDLRLHIEEVEVEIISTKKLK